MRTRGTLRTRATGVALAALLAGAGAAPALADPLTVEKDGVVTVEKALKVGGQIQAGSVTAEKGLEVGPNGAQANEKGATVQGFNGRNYFQDSEKAGALRVGALNGTPGIYSEKGDVALGSQSGKIQLKGAVEAASFSGKGALPVNAIVMWSGSLPNMPDGWALCDGRNDTPDLLDRFVSTTRTEYAVAYIMYKASSDGKFRIPNGSYLATCESAQLTGTILEASCKSKDGWSKIVSKLDLKTCPKKGDIWNKDGKLLCK